MGSARRGVAKLVGACHLCRRRRARVRLAKAPSTRQRARVLLAGSSGESPTVRGRQDEYEMSCARARAARKITINYHLITRKRRAIRRGRGQPESAPDAAVKSWAAHCAASFLLRREPTWPTRRSPPFVAVLHSLRPFGPAASPFASAAAAASAATHSDQRPLKCSGRACSSEFNSSAAEAAAAATEQAD